MTNTLFFRGQDILDYAVYSRWFSSHFFGYCVARASTRREPQRINETVYVDNCWDNSYVCHVSSVRMINHTFFPCPTLPPCIPFTKDYNLILLLFDILIV